MFPNGKRLRDQGTKEIMHILTNDSRISYCNLACCELSHPPVVFAGFSPQL
jgi:hypothetical protein